MNQILEAHPELPSRSARGIPQAVDSIVMRGLAREPRYRFATAREMAMAIESVLAPATTREVGDWVVQIAGETLDRRAEKLAEIESVSTLIPREIAPAAAIPRAASAPSIQSEVGSQSTGLSLSTTEHAARMRGGSNKAVLLIAVVAVGGLLVGIIAALILTAGQSRTGPSAATGAPVDTTVSSSSVALPADTATPDPVVDAQPDAAPEPSATRKPPSKNTGRPPAPPPATTAAPPAKKCNPPWTVGPDGIKHPKPECF
jgi:serine/threonine-protein kinase